MLVKYDTGEVITVTLIGNAEDANIRLEKGSLKLDSTYITLSSAKTIKIFNRSDILVGHMSSSSLSQPLTNFGIKKVNFSWKMFSTHAEDRQYRLRKKIDMDTMESIECTKFFTDLVS
jgi:hydrocephalus-inducing protein